MPNSIRPHICLSEHVLCNMVCPNSFCAITHLLLQYTVLRSDGRNLTYAPHLSRRAIKSCESGRRLLNCASEGISFQASRREVKAGKMSDGTRYAAFMLGDGGLLLGPHYNNWLSLIRTVFIFTHFTPNMFHSGPMQLLSRRLP